MKTSQTNWVTYLGILIAFLAVPLVVFIFSLNSKGPYTNGLVIQKELSIFLIVIVLLAIAIKGEKKGFDSIGLHPSHWGKSLLLALGMAILTLVAVVGCALLLEQFGIPVGGEEGKRYESVSLWVITLVTIRAGVVEEICYRGYLMERLENLSNGNFWIFFILPLVIFALAHYSQGIAGYIISFVAGGIMAYFYWKKRDLKANILAHFLVDFIPNVLLQLT